MSTGTAIQWTDHSWNPWWGCVKVAQGCRNCYAERDSARFYGRKLWGPNSERRIASEKVWNDPLRWNRAAERAGVRAKVFCLSMGDILEDHPALIEPRKRAIGVIESTPWLDWQLLTKRPENHAMFGWGDSWPGNVWFGASAAIQEEFETVVGAMLDTHAQTRFLSLEPLIGAIDMRLEKTGDWTAADYARDRIDPLDVKPYRMVPTGIHWVIVGGESGPDARPCDVGWIRAIVGQCRAAAVPVFVKQLGAVIHWDGIQGGYLDGPSNVWPRDTGSHEVPGWFRKHLCDKKGGDWSEWPEDLRVREFPAMGVQA